MYINPFFPPSFLNKPTPLPPISPLFPSLSRENPRNLDRKRKIPPPMESQTEADTLECVLAEQRRQITEAKTLDTDLDFAFNLQMQEAITASLSETSRQNDVACVKNDVACVKNDDEETGFDYTALLLEDMERLEQERRDREASEKLTREMREDLDRRIYDQRFANEIMNIPDAQWDHDGEYYNKPYNGGDGASSSSSSSYCKTMSFVDSEAFKVYCKGLQSEERIRDMKVIVGGIGVAICDSTENLIWEVSKGLEVRGGEEVAVAEMEAVVEGLNAALSLDLKNVVFICDDSAVYQYVTGAGQSSETRTSTLLNDVSLLQKKFTDCQPSLVSQTDLKYAFKLARAAIVSQIAWKEETSESENSLKETCVICFEDKDVNQMFSVEGCLHRFCFACMKQHVEAKLLNGMEAKCPQEGCESEVSIETCGNFMDPKIFDMMVQRKKEASIAITERVYCPFLRCSTLMSKTEVLAHTLSSFVGAENSGARKCIKCQQFFCINCRVPWHYNITCDNNKRVNPYPRAEDGMLNNLARQKQWRQCVRCSHMVELAEGCYHITCRCGYEFCYTCGAEWKGKRPTCNCRIWDERNIIHDGRRQY